MKRSHGVNVQNLIQKIENNPQRHALQSDLQQHRPFNLFSKESRDVIQTARNTELCEPLDVEPEAQCKYVCRTGTSASSIAGAGTSCEAERKRTRNTSSSLLTSFRFPITTSRKATPRPPLREETRGSQVLHRDLAQEEMKDSERP